MHHPVLYLFYPRRNPSLSYTRQIQGIIAFILFVLITIAAPDLAGALFIPSLGASVVVAVTSIFLTITSTHLSRIVEDQLEQALNYRLQRIAPHHARAIKNNLHPTEIRDIQLDTEELPASRTDTRVRRPKIVRYDHRPINQPELVEPQPNDDRIHLRDSTGLSESPDIDYSYLNDIPYQHLRTDALAIADSLMADPPIVIDYRMIIHNIWQRPGNYAIEKEMWRWVCYGIHVGIYISPVWWALRPDWTWQTRVVPVAIHSLILLSLLGYRISKDARLCQTALNDGSIEKYLYRLYQTNKK